MASGVWGAIERLSFCLLAPGFGAGNWHLDKAYERLWHQKGYLQTSTESALWTGAVLVKEMVFSEVAKGTRTGFVLCSDLGGHLRKVDPGHRQGQAKK